MAIVHIIRHGKTHYNEQGILTGRGSDPELTEYGISQAQDIAQHIHKNYIEHIDLVVSSNMTRTNKTAEIINELLQKPMSFDMDLQEKHHGGFEGHSLDYALPILNALADDETHPIHGAERRDHFDARITNSICKYFHMEEHKSVLLVSHGFVIERAHLHFKEEEVKAHNAHLFTLDPKEIDLQGKCTSFYQKDIYIEDL
ncbi:MAG: histidine phosphatase family protein [Rickettsiales bacterium]|jgi:probable phosphoglycerate mutase|nr:histidine phosphatase family protein [Rickettsiales bacterium]